MIQYAISNRALFGGEETERRQQLLRQVERLARIGVDYFQVREKDLGTDELTRVVAEMVDAAGTMKILVNTDAVAARYAGAAGVHLPPGSLQDVHDVSILSAGARNVDQVKAAVEYGVQLILFAPVFGKSVWGEDVLPGVGLDALHEAVVAAGKVPVLALGGVTAENTQSCLDAGAAGIAGIRLFLGDAAK